jgi:hypothetical protein
MPTHSTNSDESDTSCTSQQKKHNPANGSTQETIEAEDQTWDDPIAQQLWESGVCRPRGWLLKAERVGDKDKANHR